MHRNDKPEDTHPFIYMHFILNENYNDIEIKKVYETRAMVGDI